MVDCNIQKITSQGLTLAETYPYLAWLAGPLASKRPDWLKEFKKTEMGKIDLDQANNFAFIAFAEVSWPEEFYSLAAEVIEEGPDYLARELANTADWFDSEARD